MAPADLTQTNLPIFDEIAVLRVVYVGDRAGDFHTRADGVVDNPYGRLNVIVLDESLSLLEHEEHFVYLAVFLQVSFQVEFAHRIVQISDVDYFAGRLSFLAVSG
jgi:hypothetical protein